MLESVFAVRPRAFSIRSASWMLLTQHLTSRYSNRLGLESPSRQDTLTEAALAMLPKILSPASIRGCQR